VTGGSGGSPQAGKGGTGGSSGSTAGATGASGGTPAGGRGSGGGSGRGGAGGTSGGPASGAAGDSGRAGASTGGVSGTAGTPGGGMGNSGAGGAAARDPVVYVGGSSEVRAYDFDRETGALTPRGGAMTLGPNPSYLAVTLNKKFLLVTNESDGTMGGITSAAIGSDGALTLLNHQAGSDGGFTFVGINAAGTFAIGASYNGGSVSVFPLGADGMLGAESDNRDFGSGAQSHAVAFDASGEHVFVPNKGNDEVAQLLLGGDGTLTPNTPASVMTANGAGPRHIALHPNGSLAFVINELDDTMTPYALSTGGALTAGTPVSTLPAGFSGQNTGAHVEITPDGRFVYGSNRGHDSIVAFAADQTTGALTLIEHEPCGGSTPRDFDLDPLGTFIVVANQNSSNLAAFRIESDGKLSALGSPTNGPQGAQAVQIVYLP
jgi:6-phosphogluconolactonase